MYGRLGNTELFGGSPNGSPVLDHVDSQRAGPLFHAPLQKGTSHDLTDIKYAGKWEGMNGELEKQSRYSYIGCGRGKSVSK